MNKGEIAVLTVAFGAAVAAAVTKPEAFANMLSGDLSKSRGQRVIVQRPADAGFAEDSRGRLMPNTVNAEFLFVSPDNWCRTMKCLAAD